MTRSDTRGSRALARIHKHLGRYGSTKRIAEAIGRPRSSVSALLHGHYDCPELMDRIELILCRMDSGQSLQEAAADIPIAG